MTAITSTGPLSDLPITRTLFPSGSRFYRQSATKWEFFSDGYRYFDTEPYRVHGMGYAPVSTDRSDPICGLRGALSARQQWEELCDAWAAEARDGRSARGLLADAKARALVRQLGGRTHSQDLDYYAARKVQHEAAMILSDRQTRVAHRSVADLARAGQPRRIAKLVPIYRQRRADAAKARAAKRLGKALVGERVGRAALDELIPTLRDKVSTQADQLIRCVVRAVGVIGEQCRADLSNMSTDESFSGKKSRNHKLEKTTLERVEHLSDWSSALITMRDFTQVGRSGWGSNGDYGSRGGNSYRCYLVVRDSTTGEAHILRVPPKFGNAGTQFFARFCGGRERIQAARDWCAEGAESGGRCYQSA